jgi:hypothetical protein
MGSKRKKVNKGLPRGVYKDKRRGERFNSRYWNGEKLVNCGTFGTPEEADYKGLLMRYGHHWQGMDKGKYFGFTYLITHKDTGKRYVGKKQFFLWDGPVGGYKCTDLGNEWWDEKAWQPNNWEFYTGSQNDLNEEIAKGNVWDFKYEVLDMCKTKLDLHVSELNHMIRWDVLEAVDAKGDYLWYNKNIASLEFRPPFRKADVLKAKQKTVESMRRYYLKPDHCSCGALIAYGDPACCAPPEVISRLSPETLGFTDVR